MGGKDGSLAAHPHGRCNPFTQAWKWGITVFWVHFLLVCIKNKEKSTISACANTDILSLPTSVQNRYFQSHSGAKTQRCRGRCSDLSAHHARPTKGRFHPGYLSNNNYAQSSGAGKNAVLLAAHTNTHVHREISTELLPLCGRYFLCLAYRQPWQQWVGLLSQLLEKKEKEKKNRGLGNVQTKAFCLLTAVSKVTCKIPCEGIHQKDVLKAHTNSWSFSIHWRKP